ncbi:hypothetical protein AB1K70_02615 [Bremerella sp. JC770]|uniref:hypothetical protein n=1 Tax=Bremerella sp. JC770 TaxID=3232137 RepID=UPI003459C10A
MKRTQSLMKTKQPRRGALLLVVLSILVLFALVGLTFVVSALAFNTGAQANLERDSQASDASNEADATVMQLLRGPRAGTSSVILGHSLLRDMWGNQSVVVTGTAAQIEIERPEDSAGTDIAQLWEIEIDNNLVDTVGLFRAEQYYTGSVLTFTSGELKGQSHRILHYRLKFNTDTMGNVTADGVVFVIDQDPIVARENLVDLDGNGGISPVDGDDFVVNDPPFNGTGLGYDPTNITTNKRSLSLLDGTDPVALLPNIPYNFPDGQAGGISIEAGGADEPYDAPDAQNMFLTFVTGGRTTSTAEIFPAFHRPDLLRYWRQKLAEYSASAMPGGSDVWAGLSDAQKVTAFEQPYGPNDIADDADVAWDVDPFNDMLAKVARGVMLRPSKSLHPSFTGSNADFNMFGETHGTASGTARWDIDNDLDGIPDSIWIDIGLPLKTDRQGRRYKPLAAIMVKDMDALINVNAHGFYSQFASFENGTFPPTGTPADATTLLSAFTGTTNQHNQYSPSWDSTGSTAQNMQVLLGSGYGPAEVSLRKIFTAQNAFDLLQSRYQPAFNAPAAQVLSVPRPGRDTDSGSVPGDDERSRMDNIGLTNAFATTINNRFGTPPDRLGLGRTYIDYSGRPRLQPQVEGSALGSQPAPASFGQRANDPYEFDPLHPYRYDSPFTYQELERVLRYEEYDSSSVTQSNDRLMELAALSLKQNSTVPTTTQQAQERRRLITTASFQVPTANRVDIPYDLRDEDLSGSTPQNMMFAGKTASERRPAPTLVALLQERLRQENSWDPSVPSEAKLLKDKVYQLLPPEIFRGEPFDLNRLLEAPADGNGTDDIFDLQNDARIMFQTGIGSSSANTPSSDFRFLNWLNGSTGVGCNPPALPSTIDYTNPTSYSASRQLMARYLYVMVLLLMEDDYLLPTIDNSLTDTQKRELTLRRIAQWAINVVDFRDRDAVMTPFEYDLNPFIDDEGTNNPWNVDGNLSTVEDVGYRRVVWGAESPELVLSETLAFHDRRTKDTAWDDSTRTPITNKTRASNANAEDPNLDQYRIPQGSLFIELYNPRNLTTNNNYLPPELYDSNGLMLDNKTPGGDPVWRIVITSSDLDTSPAASTNVIEEIATHPDTINFQPRDVTVTTDATTGEVTARNLVTTDPAYLAMLEGDGVSNEDYHMERIIWFVNPTRGTATTVDDPTKTFYYRGSNDLRIVPDGYSVVGPRQTTYIGSKPLQASATVATANRFINEPSAQSIILEDISGTVPSHPGDGINDGRYSFNNTQSPNGVRRDADMDFAVTADLPNYSAAAPPFVFTNDPDGSPTGIGLSITEPLPDQDYYDVPTIQNLAPNLTIYDLYADGVNPGTAPTSEFCPDTPFDTDPSRDYPLSLDPRLADTGTFPAKDDKTETAVIEDFKTAILQRLANPLSDHDAALNPYITVDQLSIDITVFNGEDSYDIHGYTAGPSELDWDPDEVGDETPTTKRHARNSNDVYFAGREKGRRDDNVANDPLVTELEGDAGTPSFSSGNYFGVLKRISQITGTLATDLDSMLEEFNQTPPIHDSPIDATLNTQAAPDTDEHFGRKLIHTMGYVNHNLGAQISSSITGINSTYQYSPIPQESGRQSDPYTAGTGFGCENNPLSYIHWPNAPFVSEYDLMMVPTSSPQRLLFEYSGARKNDTNSAYDPFYFASGSTDGDSLDARLAPYAYLFNFFHGTATDGLDAAATPGNAAKAMQLARLFDFVHIPSRYNGTKKWFDVTQFNPASGDLRTDSTKTEDARLGYMYPFNRTSEFREPGKINLNTISSETVYNSIFDPDFWQNTTDFDFASWTEFLESRRGYSGAYDPAYPSRFSNPFRPAAAAELMPVLHSNDKRLLVAPEEAGLLRSADRGATTRTPLFDLKLNDITLGNDKMRHYRTDDNPMLRYQAYQRLGNIAGTQSNVFAVWVTIGYFEVEPVAVSPTHPDGWALAEELGNDTGEINRHRAFYIIDRSIPVGFVPGEDLNVEDTIMLKRFIE